MGFHLSLTHARFVTALRWVTNAHATSCIHDSAMLHDEHESKVVLEEDMKQAFMRSVCCLNIEAISVMNRAATGKAVPAAVIGAEGEGGEESDDGIQEESSDISIPRTVAPQAVSQTAASFYSSPIPAEAPQ